METNIKTTKFKPLGFPGDFSRTSHTATHLLWGIITAAHLDLQARLIYTADDKLQGTVHWSKWGSVNAELKVEEEKDPGIEM